MARVLEILKQNEAPRDWPTSPVASPRPFRPDPEPATLMEEDANVPFVEVGGPRVVATAVPSPVMASPSAAEGHLQVQFQPLSAVLTSPSPAGLASEVVAYHQPGHRVSEQYRRVLCEIAVQAPAEARQVLLFTSPQPCAGTTTVLLNLAVSYARQNTGRIALVDTNFHRPAIAERLGLSPSPGLQEVLSGLRCVNDAVRETPQPNLFALTAGLALRGETALLGGEAMRQILRDLRGRFQWVFVDAPAWADRPEVLALGAACDGVYLVVPQAQADSPEARDVHRLMPLHGTPLRGRIVTQQ